jgi:hypothetical protein
MCICVDAFLIVMLDSDPASSLAVILMESVLECINQGIRIQPLLSFRALDPESISKRQDSLVSVRNTDQKKLDSGVRQNDSTFLSHAGLDPASRKTEWIPLDPE